MAVTTNREPGPFPRDERKRDQWFTQLRTYIESIAANATDGAAPAVVDVATADAPTQTAAYVQADAQDIADLANDNKTQINALLAALRTAGIVTT